MAETMRLTMAGSCASDPDLDRDLDDDRDLLLDLGLMVVVVDGDENRLLPRSVRVSVREGKDEKTLVLVLRIGSTLDLELLLRLKLGAGTDLLRVSLIIFLN